MRIALADIAKLQKARLRRLIDPSDELIEVPEDGAVAADVLIASRYDAKHAARISFRLLQAPGAGLDKIALDLVPPEAWVCNAYEHEGPIAEYVFAAMLDHAVGFSALVRQMPEKGWVAAYHSRRPHGELAGRTLGLLGFGHIGQAIAKRAKAFDMRVMAIAATPRATAPDVDWIATPDKLGEMLAGADYLVIASVLNEATRGMIGAAQLRQMKPSAVIINIARAEIAVEEDLYAALKAGTIGGAVLDPWYRYPATAADTTEPSRFPFASLPNVKVTPHAAAWTDGVWDRRSAFFARNIARFKAGEPLMNVVRPPLAVRGHA